MHKRRVGESGSCKSTLLRMVLGLIRPTRGTITIDVQDVSTLRRRDEKIFRRKVQPIFQNAASSFKPHQSIDAILRAPLEVHGIGDRDSRRDRVAALLEQVGQPTPVVMAGSLASTAILWQSCAAFLAWRGTSCFRSKAVCRRKGRRC